MSKSKQATDKYELVTNKIIALLEKGVAPWRKPWFSTPYQNIATGHLYQGRNPLFCAIDMLENGWTDPFFVGFHQGKSLGWTLAKGSKSTWIRFGSTVGKEVEKEDGSTATEFRSMCKWHNVFHISCWSDEDSDHKIADYIQKRQVEFIPLTTPRPEQLERFIKAQQSVITYGGDRCFYSPVHDQIQMAEYETFRSMETFYSTLVHEHIHRTGHPSRLGRDMSGSFGTQSYAKEELVAELGAAFVCNALSIECEIEHHASYIASWLNELRGDSKAFFKALDAGQKAADLLLETGGIKQAEETIAA